MISKKRAAAVCALFCAICIALTYVLVVVIPNKDGERYVTSEKYKLIKKYEQLGFVLDTINDYYYKGADATAVMNAAISGAADSLGDPYTIYYTEEEYQKLLQDNSGEYDGIGITITQSGGKIIVLNVFSGSPAEAAGIKAMDVVVNIGGKDVEGMTLQEASKVINNIEGDTVALIIKRGEDELAFNVKKATIVRDMVTTKMLEDGIGYLQIVLFHGNVLKQFKEGVKSLESQGAKGIVMDVRDNGGGSLYDVTEMLDYLLPEETIVYTLDKNGKKEEWKSDASCDNIPIVVLVNGNSASASEIFAGALQDYARAPIIGETTFGKGIVQTLFSIPNSKAGLRITTATYYTPSGRCIHGIGITPDFQVTGSDEQLSQAVSVLKQKISGF